MSRAKRLTADDIDWGAKPSISGTTPDDYTEDWFAKRFATAFGSEFRFDHRRGLWLMWSAGQWSEDAVGVRYRRVAALARQLHVEAARLADPAKQRHVTNFAISAQSRNRIEATLYLAKYQTPIANRGDGWDTQPMLLNTPGGVVDLRTAITRPATPADLMRLCTAVAPAENADCPRWMRFLEEVLNADTEVMAWFHRFSGYLLTCDTSEQCFIVGWGTGANGKGTCFNTLAYVMGTYAFNLPFSAMELHARSSIPNDLACLVNRRFVTSSESGEATRLNESRIKMLTGGDTVTARFLNREFFEFRPVAKYVLFTNAKPVIRDDSHGMWRRVRLLPFTRTFPIDKALEGELRAEGPGILRWMLDGCLAWQRDGLTTPAAIAAATRKYQVDQNHLQQFLDAQCIVAPSEVCRAGELFKVYQTWCEVEGFHQRERLNQRGFGEKIKAQFDSLDERPGVRYLGVAPRCV